MGTDMTEMAGKNAESTVEAALSDDGSGLTLTRELARVLGEPHAGADGRHDDEPSPFHDGDLGGNRQRHVHRPAAAARRWPRRGLGDP